VIGVHRLDLARSACAALWLALHLAFFLVFSALMLSIHSMALEAVDGRVPTVNLAPSHFGSAASYLLTSAIYWFTVLLGLCLFVVPGLIAATTWAPFRFLLADGSAALTVPLREASLLSSSHRWRVFRAFVTSVLLNLAGAALLGLGLLVSFPVTIILRARLFRQLQAKPAPIHSRPPSREPAQSPTSPNDTLQRTAGARVMWVKRLLSGGAPAAAEAWRSTDTRP
jgi:uncharacterized membrane protein